MPCQVSWQSAAIKSQALVHGLGAEAAVAGEGLVGTTSAAHASTSHEAPAAARIIAAKLPSFVMRAPCLNMDDCDLVRGGRKFTVGAISSHGWKSPKPSGGWRKRILT